MVLITTDNGFKRGYDSASCRKSGGMRYGLRGCMIKGVACSTNVGEIKWLQRVDTSKRYLPFQIVKNPHSMSIVSRICLASFRLRATTLGPEQLSSNSSSLFPLELE